MTAAGRVVGPCLAALLYTGCGLDDGSDVVDPPPPDAGPPPRTDCFEPLARSTRFEIGRCPDQAHMSLIATTPAGARVAFEGVAHSVQIGGETIGADAWTVIVWSPRDDGLTVSYSGHPIAPDVRVDLDFDGPCLAGRTVLAFDRSASLDAVDVFAPGPDARIDRRPRWTLAGGAVVPADIDTGITQPRLLAQLGVGLALGGLDPERPLVSAARPTLTLPGPLAAGADDTLGIPWALCFAGGGAAALDALGDRAAAWSGAMPRTHRPRLAAHHSVDPERPDALRAEVDRIRRADRFGHLWLDGDWAADRAQWTPRDAIAELPQATEPATVGLVWPALSLPANAPLILLRPEWLDGDCDRDCPRLDPRIPAVREHLARIRIELDAAGFAVRLAGIDHLTPTDQRGLLAALTVGDAPTPTVEPRADPSHPPVELGLSPAISRSAPTVAAAAQQLAILDGLRDAAHIEATAAIDPDADAAARRQHLALALIAGFGALPPLDGDRLDAAIAPVLAVWQQVEAPATAQPMPGAWFTGADAPSPAPSDWRADDRLILFNWSDDPRVVDDPLALAPDLIGARRVLQPERPRLGAEDRIEIPPGDAVVWSTVDGGPPGE